MKTLLILPNQLFKKHDFEFDEIILYEHPKFFTEYNYHKSKLVFHRATMKKYYDNMKKKYTIKYLEYDDKLTFKNELIIYDPTDFDIMKEIKSICKKNKIELTILDTKLFILNLEEINEYLDETKKPYFNATFYKWVRTKKDILVNNGHPYGGKWSYDILNRLPFKQTYSEKQIKFIENSYITEATKYVERNFKDNIGEINIFLPIDHIGAENWFNKFVKERLKNFGPYEDAISSKVILGYHSGISALLNIGLLDVNDVINKVLPLKRKIKIESLEAFIRQIISWREYVRMLYLQEHDKFNKDNFLKHNNKLTKVWYTGHTGIPPIDNVIKKALNISYAHHIERLMVTGNFMLLMQIKPTDVYKWFIEMISIDAYEWVMEPNVYGMSQHSVGQLMMNRPYYSSSNYIFKMSNYKKSNNFDKIKLKNEEYHWYEIWDALYYNFINTHTTYLKKIYATANSVSQFNKKSDTDKKNLLKIAKLYMDKY
jgi:deoxyribodipyrimidine photolyase-related protein